MLRRALILALAALLALPAAAGQQQEQQIAREMLSDLQAPSIRASREYCGLIGIDAQGRYVVGPIAQGSETRCTFLKPRTAVRLVASFHTHGAYMPGYDNEVPSIIDLEAEREQGTRGYVATPGGRFWLVDGARSRVVLICGPKCLPWDPRYRDAPVENIRRSYSRRELFERAR